MGFWEKAGASFEGKGLTSGRKDRACYLSYLMIQSPNTVKTKNCLRGGPGESVGLAGPKNWNRMSCLGPAGEKGEETEDSGSVSEDP
jgi:hypothetical protein